MSTTGEIKISTKFARTSKQTSLVWDYFGCKLVNGVPSDDGRVYCTICFNEDGTEATVGAKSGTNNMFRHLLSVHKLALKDLIKEKKTKNDVTQQSIVNFLETEPSSQQSSEASQESIDAVKRKRDLKPIKAFLRLCYTELLDIEIIKRPSTRTFLSNLACLRINSDLTEKTMLEEMTGEIDAIEKKIIACLADVKNISISLYKNCIHDFENKVIVKLGFMDTKWKLHSYFLSLSVENMFSKNSAPLIKKVLDKFQISVNTIYLITGDKDTIQRNCEKISCLGHEINNILHSDEVQIIFTDLFNKMKYLFREIYFCHKKHTVVNVKLIEASIKILKTMKNYENLKVFPNSSISSGSPPWHIQKFIVDITFELRDEIETFKSAYDDAQHFPSDQDYELLKTFQRIYNIFMCAINSIYRANEPFVSVKMALKRYLLKELGKLLGVTINSNERNIIECINTSVTDQINLNEFEVLCTTLDVRCINLADLKSYYQKLEKTPEELLKLYLTINIQTGTSAKLTYATKSKEPFQSIDLFEDDDSMDSNMEHDVFSEEIKKYLSCVEKPDSILTWWKNNKTTYTNLSSLAEMYVATPVISYPRDCYNVHYATKIIKLDAMKNYESEIAFLHFNN